MKSPLFFDYQLYYIKKSINSQEDLHRKIFGFCLQIIKDYKVDGKIKV